MKLFVIFGPAGSGKTYIGKLLKKSFDFYFFEGDSQLTDEMKIALTKQKEFTDQMRDVFFKKLFNSFSKKSVKFENIALAQTFTKEKYRKDFIKLFPNAKFILIKTSDDIRFERLAKRKKLPLSKNYVKKMDSHFEEPNIMHDVIMNDVEGESFVTNQLRRLIAAQISQ